MKNNRSPLYLLFAVLIVLICISPASAQTPPKPESAASNPTSASMYPPEASPELPVEYAPELLQADSAGLSPMLAGMIGEEFSIATVYDSAEYKPSVAYCMYGQYLAVFVKDYDIYGQRISETGALIGSPFAIYAGPYDANAPDVACEWTNGLFIVTWHVDYANQHNDYDVYAQAVYGNHQTSGSQLIGDRIVISQDTAVYEMNPHIACNNDDRNCLVVFEYSGTGDGDIYAQRVTVNASSITKLGDRFNLGLAAAEDTPDVAWSGPRNNYMVVWQYTASDPERYQIVYALIYDTDQGAASEIQKGITYLHLMTNENTQPAVAYNRLQNEYFVVFSHLANSGTERDIFAQRTDGSSNIGSYLIVSSDTYDQSQPVVAFSGGTENLPGLGKNQYLVVYVANEGVNGYALYAVTIKGNATFMSSDNQRVLISRYSTVIERQLRNPAVTGTLNNGTYLAVYDRYQPGFTPRYDVLGRRISPYPNVNLPLLVRP